MGGLINKFLRADLIRLIDERIACCGCGGAAGSFGLTTLSPPVDAPAEGDPTWLGNITTGELWYWNGSAWTIANAGGTDTNFFNTNLTQLANRTHDGDGFTTTINDAGTWSIETRGTNPIGFGVGVNGAEASIAAVANAVRWYAASGIYSFFRKDNGASQPPTELDDSTFKTLTVDIPNARMHSSTSFNNTDVRTTVSEEIKSVSGYYVNAATGLGDITWNFGDGGSSPAAAVGTVINVKNRGDSLLKIQTVNIENLFYTNLVVNFVDLFPGDFATFHFDGTYWNVQ